MTSGLQNGFFEAIDPTQDESRLRDKSFWQLGAYVLSYVVKIQLVVLLSMLRGIFGQRLYYEIMFIIRNEEE